MGCADEQEADLEHLELCEPGLPRNTLIQTVLLLTSP